MVNCPSNCVDQKDELEIFGTLKYSSDSAICLAAFHAGSLSPEGGDFMVKINKGLP